MSNPFDLYLSDIVHYLTCFLPLLDLIKFASSSKYLEKLISKDEKFWEIKCRNNLDLSFEGTGMKSEDQTWKKFYINIYLMKVFTFGSNFYGELGISSNSKKRNACKPTKIENLKFRDISISYHVMAIDLNNNVWVWGNNTYGQLGLGSNGGRMRAPVQLEVDSIQNFKAKSLATGSFHSAIIDMENNIWTFGENESGQLGLGDNIDRNEPTQVVNFKASQISLGYTHTVIIDLNNNIWVCGDNQFEDLGLGDNQNRNLPTQIPGAKAKQIFAGHHHTVFIDMEDNVWVFGRMGSNQLELVRHGINRPFQIIAGSENLKAKQVSAGNDHTVIIDLENNVWAFGHNNNGQLGLGDTMVRYIQQQILGLKAQQVATGGSHTILLDMENNVWTFGYNDCGQLGIGNKKNRNSPTQILNIKAWKIAAGQSSSAIITI